MKLLLLIASIALLPIVLKAEYNKLEWTDCGSKQVDIYQVDVKPMPILQPGQATLTLKAFFKKALRGKLRTILDIKRTVSGLTLPIRCYLASGIYVGSCTYDDLCPIIATLLEETFTPEKCPPGLAEYGIDCTCPFQIRSGLIEIVDELLELPDAQETIFTFLSSGDFDIKIDTADGDGPFGCVIIKFTVKPSKPGK